MKSTIDIGDAVANKTRKFGAANAYFPVRLRGFSFGRRALFTLNQILEAEERARRNPEDFPAPTLLERIAEWLRGVRR